MMRSAPSLPRPLKVLIRNWRIVRASVSSSSSSSNSSVTLLRGACAAVGQADFDLKRIAAIDRRRPRRRGVELARHDLVQTLENQFFADRTDAIGRRVEILVA